MPTYNYKCDSCDHYFTVLQSMNDGPIKKCGNCGEPVKRIISGGTGMIFKGDGFYLTDYARKKNSAENGNGKPGKKSEQKTVNSTQKGEVSE